jgi:ATP-dependent RNA helicase RhlE
MKFIDLKISPTLVSALEAKGYSTPTPIQQQAIPPILEGKDIFGCAQTGTGKTAAFALPILQMLSSKADPQKPKKVKALILAPTRELANQIGESFRAYGKNLSITYATVYGGVPQHTQTRMLKQGVDVLIATPGRLLDLINQNFVKLNDIEFFVLDEADRMLDMGFIDDIRKLIVKLPKAKQTMFFSATVSPQIMLLANTLLKNPVRISITPVSTASVLIEQSVYYVKKENKRSLLTHVLKSGKIEHALVFTRTKRGADKVASDLNKSGIKAESIHGNKSQGARERALNGFKKRSIRILVATDIASRGIDVDKLTHVINYEIPEQAETYVHRIGRTGRAGTTGTAVSFCAREEMPYLKDINKLIKKNIEVVISHPFAN